MRRTRRLILLLLALIVGGVAVVYTIQKGTQARNAPSRPRTLPDSVSAQQEDWTYDETRDGKPFVRVRARDFKQNAEGNRIDLTGVELHLFQNDGKTFDRIRSQKADFDLNAGVLFSDGDVEITMGVPEDPAAKPAERLVVIKTSGVHFDKNSGKAWTERAASFSFDRGEGSSTGAAYDPTTRELRMDKDVKLHWRGDNPKAAPMDIESGALVYKEAEHKIFLSPWSKLRRQTLAMDGGNATVLLNEGAIEQVLAESAKGVDTQPKRTIEYAADNLDVRFNEKGALQTVVGDRNARLLSATATSKTAVHSGHIDLEFEPAGDESVLRKAIATQGAVVESRPVARPNAVTPDTRVLKSEILTLFMRENGEEMERVETGAPATAEFLPNHPGSQHRTILGDRMSIKYGAGNQVQSVHATGTSTRTDRAPVKGKPQPPALTWSKTMNAAFDEKTGAVSHLEQVGDFRYQEGERRAKAERADLFSPSDDIILTGAARVWDPTGSTSADKITMRQKAGEVEAVGKVASTREPEKKKTKDTGLMSGEEPIQARAAKMLSTEDNSVIVYEGDALLWQGSNRITANRIRIDRKTGRLHATGNVVTQLVDKSDAKKTQPVFTVVRSPEFSYDDKARLAHYTGGASLNRSGTVVTGKEIRAWLTSDQSDSSVDRAFADGNVKIVQSAKDRSRTGTSEHAEYYIKDGKIVLTGGQPAFADTTKGTTKGERITYISEGDKLLVEGESKRPVESKVLRK